MFLDVFKTFSLFSVTFSLFIVAFGLGFYVLLNTQVGHLEVDLIAFVFDQWSDLQLNSR